MEKLLSALIEGASYGGVYALLAVGLTLAYKTSGVFNIAFGAQAFVSGAIYYQLHNQGTWPILPAFLVSVVIAAPLLGLVLDRLLFRHLRSAPALSRLIVSLGLLVAIPEVAKLFYEIRGASEYQGIVPNGGVIYRPIAGVGLTRDEISILVCAVLVVVGVSLLFNHTPWGLRMRAVVESSRMTQLAGVNAEMVGMSSWMLTSFVAGLAGVLLPIAFQQVADVYYTNLLVAAIAAAAFASLTNVTMAFFGALALGVLQQVVAIYLPKGNILASSIRPSLPFIVLFAVLIFSPALRNRREVADPLAGVDPPPPAPAAVARSRELTIATYLLGLVVGSAWFYFVLFQWSEIWMDRTIRILIYSVIFCSIVVITGMAGQVSFAQATFAAIGGFFSAQLATKQGMSILVAILVAAAVAALVGAVLGLVALRLGGIFLTLATYAFALFFDNTMVKYDWVGGGIFPIASQRPLIGPIDFANDKAFLGLCLVILVIVGTAVIWVRNGTTGRYLAAIRGSETAAASIGINATRARIVAFALSAFIAGVGGGLLFSYNKQADLGSFNPTFGLFWVVVVVTLGPRTVEGAIQAAFGFIIFAEWVLPTALPWLINLVSPFGDVTVIAPGWQQIFFGLGAVTYAKHPEGILEFRKSVSLAKWQGRIDRWKARRNAGPQDAAVAGGVS